jgi:hypothetical protein
MEEMLGTVYRRKRGLLLNGQYLKCCKISNKVFRAKVRSFSNTPYISFPFFLLFLGEILYLQAGYLLVYSKRTENTRLSINF